MGSNSKAYLLLLLLPFLLVHTSAALFSLKNLEKFFDHFNFGMSEAADIHNYVHKYYKTPHALTPPQKNDVAPPPPAFKSPQEIIDGLKSVKEYLNTYGYFPDSDKFTDVMDDQAKSSIEEYQKFFNLNVTGKPDNDTLQHMSLLRCAVPDKNLTYDIPEANFSWPLGTKWFPNGRMNLTYGFAPANKLPENVIKVFEDSFKRWSDAITVLNFRETKYKDADIRILFVPFGKATGPEVVGSTFIVLRAGSSSSSTDDATVGGMFLDDSKYMALPSEDVYNLSRENDGVVDMETVVMHQIGHLLGLQHSSNEDSVMYPSILPSMQRKVKLSEDDVDQISKVYFFSGGTSGCGVTKIVGSVWGLVITTLSLGLAFMILFN